jgi:Orsellinic acid/F9775 biosynthesis cluster protein D
MTVCGSIEVPRISVVVISKVLWKFFHQITIVTMNDYVTYNAKYKVLICRYHQFAIPPDGILRHFRDMHKAIPITTRKAIADYSKTLDLATLNEVATPNEPVQPVQELTVIRGFQCRYGGCSELRSTVTSMKQHCRETHGWAASTDVMWITQAFQTLFDGTRRK